MANDSPANRILELAECGASIRRQIRRERELLVGAVEMVVEHAGTQRCPYIQCLPGKYSYLLPSPSLQASLVNPFASHNVL